MKTKDKTVLRGKSLEELRKLVAEKKVEAENIKVKVLSGQEKNLKAFSSLRIEIARLLTLIREKEIVEKIQVKKSEEK